MAVAIRYFLPSFVLLSFFAPTSGSISDQAELDTGHAIRVGHTQFVPVGGITELRLSLSMAPPSWPVSNPLTLFQQNRQSCGASCPGGKQFGYQPYTGASSITTVLQGTTLIVTFIPALEDFTTYKLRVNTTLSRVSHSLEVRSLLADVTSDGRVNGADRSAVIGVWTGGPPQFTPPTDLNLDGTTNSVDRGLVVGIWTGPMNCAP